MKVECPAVDLDRELAKFRDHEFRDGKLDWSKAWRNWIRKADEMAAPRRGLNGLKARQPFKAPLTVEQIESEIARGWRDAGGSRIPGVHPDLQHQQGGSK